MISADSVMIQEWAVRWPSCRSTDPFFNLLLPASPGMPEITVEQFAEFVRGPIFIVTATPSIRLKQAVLSNMPVLP
jgi:hypothetical protein